MTRLNPVYTTPEPNTPIPLYDGPIGLGNDVGSIRFEWLPSPKARFEIPDSDSYSRSDDLALCLPGSNGPTPVLVTSITGGSHIPTSISGVLNGPMEFGTGTDLSHLIFHLTNFQSTFTLRDETPPERLTADWKPGDIFLDGGGWKVKVESVSNLDQLEKQLKSVGGYAITHVGRLERDDGSPFTADEAERMLGILRYFLSFVRGYWVALILPVGYDELGQKRWEQWGSWRLDSWRSGVSWFDSQHGECLQPAFRGFLDRWRDTALWHDPIRRALHWYIEANRGGGDVEAFIVLTPSYTGLTRRNGLRRSPEGGARRRHSITDRPTARFANFWFGLLSRPNCRPCVPDCLPSPLPWNLQTVPMRLPPRGTGLGTRRRRTARNSVNSTLSLSTTPGVLA